MLSISDTYNDLVRESWSKETLQIQNTILSILHQLSANVYFLLMIIKPALPLFTKVREKNKIVKPLVANESFLNGLLGLS